MTASMKGHIDGIQLLVQLGANIDNRGKLMQVYDVIYIYIYIDRMEGRIALIEASSNGHTAMVS